MKNECYCDYAIYLQTLNGNEYLQPLSEYINHGTIPIAYGYDDNKFLIIMGQMVDRNYPGEIIVYEEFKKEFLRKKKIDEFLL